MQDSKIETRVVLNNNTRAPFIQGFTFVIKEYQRGYRWEPAQVVALLEDIYQFNTQNNTMKYCLQPLVVKKCELFSEENRLSRELEYETYATGSENTVWELIDGQQRLTTLLLILAVCYASKKRLPYDIVYTNDRSRIDMHYINLAKKTIREWFDRFGELLADDVCHDVQQKIHSYVQFIWYQVTDIANANDIFTKLNMGKIPLTNAELFKALLLNSDNERGIKIAVEWDMTEQSLHDNDFWYFISNSDAPAETRIDYLLRLFALIHEKDEALCGKKLTKEDRLFPFLLVSALIDSTETGGSNTSSKAASAKEIWEELVHIHGTLRSWYEDHQYYHKLGFLVAVSKEPYDLLQFFLIKSNSSKKSVVLEEIDKKIKEEFDGIDLDELKYEKSSDKQRIRKVLLYFNIYTMINSRTSNKFSFRQYKNPVPDRANKKSYGWDVEHIHARAEDEELSNARPELQKEMLEDLINQLQEIDDEQGVNIVKKFIEEHPSGAEPKEFVAFYNETCDRCGEFNENGLGNLTLLDAETNRSYKNALFAVKRKKIIERDKGAVFIPVCTKNVFLKMYSNKTGLQKMQRWDAIDAECYLNEIKRVLIEEAKVCQAAVK